MLNWKIDYESVQESKSWILNRKVIVEKWPEKFKLNLFFIPVDVGIIKLKAVWTPELAQELEVYHSFDAETQLKRLLINKVNKEFGFT